MAGLDTHSVPSRSSCSHTTEGQRRICTTFLLQIMDTLWIFYLQFKNYCHYYEANGVNELSKLGNFSIQTVALVTMVTGY